MCLHFDRNQTYMRSCVEFSSRGITFLLPKVSDFGAFRISDFWFWDVQTRLSSSRVKNCSSRYYWDVWEMRVSYFISTISYLPFFPSSFLVSINWPEKECQFFWMIVFIGLVYGHVCEGPSGLLIDVGNPSSLWAVIPWAGGPGL